MNEFQDIEDPLNWPNDVTIRKIKKEFATLDEAFNYKSASKTFDNSPSVFFIEVLINEEITDQNMAKLQNVRVTNFEEKKVLFTIKSTKNDCTLIYWKTETMRKFICLKLFDATLKDIRDFVITEIKKWLSSGHNGFPLNVQKDSNSITFVDLLSLKCKDGYNLLMLAAKAGNDEAVRKLLSVGFSVNLRAADGKTAADFAWHNRHRNVLLTLLKVDSRYPEQFHNQYAKQYEEDDLDNFITEVMTFFEHIHEGRSEKIQEFTEKYPQLRVIYNYTNLSAVAYAIAMKKFNVYKTLLQRNIILPKNEDIKVITEGFEESELKALKSIHDEVAHKCPDKHLRLLALHSKISHDELDVKSKMDLIEKAYKELDNIEHISPLLKCVSECQDFIIYFDFNREWVYFMDPTQNVGTNGLFYSTGRIYIAAKGLLDPSKKNGNLGVIAHELCHFAAQIAFKNYAKPYGENDGEHEMHFNEMCYEYRGKENLHEIIASVFSHYPEENYHQEMIVRAPQLIAFYRDDPVSVQRCREEYSKLFSYYVEKFLPKVKGSTETDGNVMENVLKERQNKKTNEERVNDGASTSQTQPQPINMLCKDLKPNYEGLNLILNHAEVKDRKIVIVSIIGEHRKGKSFFMDYCLRFMYATYPSVSKPNKPVTTSNWMNDRNEPLSGFSWKHGYTADTKGILFWSDVFLHDDPSGEKVAILLMDTQGLFEPKSTFKENTRIFCLSLLLSSIQMLNINGVIQESTIEYLEMATKLTKRVGKNHNHQWKLFQQLVFLNRDWSDELIGFGYEAGEKYLESFLESDESSNTKAQEVRNNIKNSFDSIKCFLLNRPGNNISNLSFNGEWSKLDPDFAKNLEILIESLLKPENLVKKSVLGREVTAGEFKGFMLSYFEAFTKLVLPDEKNVADVMIENDLKLIVKQQFENYETSIDAGVNFLHRYFVNLEIHLNEKYYVAKVLAIKGFYSCNANIDQGKTKKYLKILEDKIKDHYVSWKALKIKAYRFKLALALSIACATGGLAGATVVGGIVAAEGAAIMGAGMGSLTGMLVEVAPLTESGAGAAMTALNYFMPNST